MKHKAFYIVQLCAFFVFIGRAYQFYFFGAPFRNILWDESLLTPIVEGIFNTSWYDYATSETVNYWIESFTIFSSFIFLVAAIVSLYWNRIQNKFFLNIIMYASLFILVFMGICMVKGKNYDILQFFEISIQLAAPILLIVSFHITFQRNTKLINVLKVIIGLVFISHGLYAMGAIYVPGHFIDMMIKILGVSESGAKQILLFIGVFDVVASVLIFVPETAKYAFFYLIIWGLVTAFARAIYGFHEDFMLRSIHNTVYLTLYRLPNGLLPLATLLLFDKYSNDKILNQNSFAK